MNSDGGAQSGGLIHHVLRDHVALGGIASLCLLPVFGLQGSLLFWLANVSIDVDHYLHYAFGHLGKSFDFKEMFRYHQALFKEAQQPGFLTIEYLHTVEFLAILGWLGFWVWPLGQPLFWGVAFHMAVDFVHLWRHRIFFRRAHSYVEYCLRRHFA